MVISNRVVVCGHSLSYQGYISKTPCYVLCVSSVCVSFYGLSFIENTKQNNKYPKLQGILFCSRWDTPTLQSHCCQAWR